jgi:predicted nuclease of predicted toxin-antitoxin system
MHILVDENIPVMTVAALRGLGHDVQDIRGTCEQGLPDTGLWALALAGKRMLITTDKGFTEP